MKLLSLLFLLFITSITYSQDSLKISGYVDTYYSYDFSKPVTMERPNFLYNYKRHNEIAINLALVNLNYTSKNVRGNLSLQTGNYTMYNMAAEPSVLKHIFQANVGVKLREGLWFDAGVMPSHIGFESAVSKDNLTLTRSVMAENSPYYETGAKLTQEYKKWTVSVMVLNGWQNIQETNSSKAFGSQIQYKASDKVLINYSTFVGNERNDSLKKATRVYNDLYAIFNIKKFDIITGVDVGIENGNTWYNTTAIARYHINDKLSLSTRFEHHNDKGVITNVGNLFGYSMNLDYQIYKNTVFRIEGRRFDSNIKLFNNSNSNNAITTALAISL